MVLHWWVLQLDLFCPLSFRILSVQPQQPLKYFCFCSCFFWLCILHLCFQPAYDPPTWKVFPWCADFLQEVTNELQLQFCCLDYALTSDTYSSFSSKLFLQVKLSSRIRNRHDVFHVLILVDFLFFLISSVCCSSQPNYTHVSQDLNNKHTTCLISTLESCSFYRPKVQSSLTQLSIVTSCINLKSTNLFPSHLQFSPPPPPPQLLAH